MQHTYRLCNIYCGSGARYGTNVKKVMTEEEARLSNKILTSHLVKWLRQGYGL